MPRAAKPKKEEPEFEGSVEAREAAVAEALEQEHIEEVVRKLVVEGGSKSEGEDSAPEGSAGDTEPVLGEDSEDIGVADEAGTTPADDGQDDAGAPEATQIEAPAPSVAVGTRTQTQGNLTTWTI